MGIDRIGSWTNGIGDEWAESCMYLCGIYVARKKSTGTSICDEFGNLQHCQEDEYDQNADDMCSFNL